MSLRKVLFAASVNWKTTGLGIAMILSAVSSFIIELLDGNPQTDPNLQQMLQQIQEGLLTLGIAAGGGVALFARDGDKSSAQSIIN